MKTGNTRRPGRRRGRMGDASMEPGHEDREYHLVKSELIANEFLPQWSPVMKTGNTPPREGRHGAGPGCLNGARS